MLIEASAPLGDRAIINVPAIPRRFDGFKAAAPGPGGMAFCPRCGKPTTPGATFCAACGTALPTAPPPIAPAATTMAPAPAMAPVAAYAQPRASQRPVGVTIIGAVCIVMAVLAGLAAMAIFAFAFIGGAAMAPFTGYGWPFTVGSAALAMFALVAALFVLAFGGLALAAGVGSMQGRQWAWVLTIVVMALNALRSVGDFAGGVRTGTFFSGVFGILVSGVVIWYYFQPDVQRWFGRAS